MKRNPSVRRTAYGVRRTPKPLSIKLTWRCLMALYSTVGQRLAETGALLCGPEGENLVTEVFFDKQARSSSVTYSPNTDHVNMILTQQNKRGLRFKGFNHSHPGGLTQPSGGDQTYARRILQAIDDLPWMWMPITQTVPDTGVFSLHSHAAIRHGGDAVSIVACALEVTELPDEQGLNEEELFLLDQLKQQSRSSVHSISLTPYRVATPVDANASKATAIEHAHGHDATFARVHDAYDLPRMHASRVIAVGMGGAAAWAEDAARAGVMQWVLIDPDTVSETNLATQQTYRQDIGRAKVDCVAERLKSIHPDVQVIALQKRLQDLSDEEVRALAFDSWRGSAPVQTVLCGLTDSFEAQARVNVLALKFALPSLCAQVYREGRGAEVTYTHPDVTPACHRCVLSSRYRYYLDEGQENDVTSHGTPIFATTRLNAIKGFVLLALLHHGSNHARWGGLLKRMGKRNLIQVRMDPDIALTLGLKVFDDVSGGSERRLFDDTVWLPQDEEAPPRYARCPDCGGTGNLRSMQGVDIGTHIRTSADAKRAEDATTQGNLSCEHF